MIFLRRFILCRRLWNSLLFLLSDCCNFYGVTVSKWLLYTFAIIRPFPKWQELNSPRIRFSVYVFVCGFFLWYFCVRDTVVVLIKRPCIDLILLICFGLLFDLLVKHHICTAVTLLHIFRCRQWVGNCNRPDLQTKTPEDLHRNYKVCSRHFETSMICQQVSLHYFCWGYFVRTFFCLLVLCKHH